MPDSNNKSPTKLISEAFAVAKKLKKAHLEDGTHLQKKQSFKAENPQQLLQNYIPQTAQRLLGKRYRMLNSVAHFIAPETTQNLSDYLFQQLNEWANHLSSVEGILDQAGIEDLEILIQDPERAQRLSQALAEQNKWLATLQGAVTGSTGYIGLIFDLPLSLILSLRTIYQIGRSYGFELNQQDELEIVEYIFQQIDSNLMLEKQSVLFAAQVIEQVLQTQDLQKINVLLATYPNFILDRWLSQTNLNTLLKIPFLTQASKIIPLFGAGVAASYNWQLIEKVRDIAQEIFYQARIYINQHPQTELLPIQAYEKSKQNSEEITSTTQKQTSKQEVEYKQKAPNLVLDESNLTQIEAQNEEQIDLVTPQNITPEK